MLVGLIQSPARQIVERLKSVMQIRESSGGKTAYSWTGACAVELIRKEGLRNGLFQGFTSVLWREIPQFAVYYPSYEIAKAYYSNVSDIVRPFMIIIIINCICFFFQFFSSDMVSQFLAGGTAGVIQWLPPIYSLDVIKSRMQAFPKGYYNGWTDCATRLYREEGLQVFYRFYCFKAALL